MYSWRDSLPIVHKSHGTGVRLFCAGLFPKRGSRDGGFFDTSIKLTHLRYELQMHLMRIFTVGFGSFSPLYQMSAIWDVCISFVLFVMVHPCKL